MNKNTISIMTVTYDRFIPYINTLLSIKPALNSKIKLEVIVDSKLSTFKFLVKSLLTKLILWNSNYTYKRGKDCIGKSRHHMLSETKSSHVLIVDDDDVLNWESLLWLTNSIDLSNHQLINFNYIPYDSYRPTVPRNTDLKRGYNWILWFGDSVDGIKVGTSTIFSVNLYKSIWPKYIFNLSKVDDFIPFHVMYHQVDDVLFTNANLVLRNRGNDSLMNSSDEVKMSDLFESIRAFWNYLLEVQYRCIEENEEIFKVTLSNQIHYHTLKSGSDFTNELLTKLSNIGINTNIYEINGKR